jgi:myo-inositol-1(or 4)-monophosphatase
MSSPGVDPGAPAELTKLRELAESAARIGGNLARESFGTHQQVKLKHDDSEVTQVDVAAERAIIDHIRARRPDDTFIGEEATEQSPIVNRQSSTVNPQSTCWVIDPIDGTRNYIRRMPVFTCSVAAMRHGAPLAGAIYDPMQDVMYSAGCGQGVYVDARRVSPADMAPESIRRPGAKLLVGIPSAQRPTIRHLVLRAIDGHVVRNLGSAALHLALAALGQLDVVVMGNGKLWDLAAGGLLVTEAGGVVTSPDGAPLFPVDVTRYAGEEIPTLAGDPAACARLMQESRAG